MYYIKAERLGYRFDHIIRTPTIGIKGEFKMKLYDINMNVKYESPWQQNMILDQGLREIGNASTGNWAGDILVGSSNAAVVATQTALVGWMEQKFAGADSNNTPTGPDWALQTTQVARFNAGEATGTIREVGLSDSGHSDNTLISARSLVTPEVVKNADQVLDVYYRTWRYPDLVDRTGTIDIEGTNYDYICRASQVDENAAPGNFGTHTTYNRVGLRTGSSNLVGANEIGSITDDITVSGISNPWSNLGTGWLGWSNSIVTPYNDWEHGWSLDYGVGNVRSFFLRESGHGNSAQRGFQIRIGQSVGDGPLVKDNTQELYITTRLSWGRYP